VDAGGGRTDLYGLLRRELTERGWTRRRFARELGLRESTVGRWLSTNPHARVVPRPATIARIARVLDFTPAELLSAAGYLDPPATLAFQPEEPLADEFRARARRFRRVLRMVPSHQQGLALQIIDVMLDALQAFVNRLDDEEDDAE
jgi:transcriptional regulator with XRE-family HTH domain